MRLIHSLLEPVRTFLEPFRLIRRLMRPHRASFRFLAALVIMRQVALCTTLFFFSVLLGGDRSVSAVVAVCVALVADYVLNSWGVKVFYQYKVVYPPQVTAEMLALRKLRRLTLRQLESSNGAYDCQRIKKGEDAVGALIDTALTQVLAASVYAAIAVVFMTVGSSWVITVWSLSVSLIAVYACVKVNNRNRAPYEKHYENAWRATQRFNEIVQKFPKIKLDRQERRIEEEHRARLDGLAEDGIKVCGRMAKDAALNQDLIILIGIIGSVVISLCLYWAGSVEWGAATLGAMLSFTLFRQVGAVTDIQAAFTRHSASVFDLSRLIRMLPESNAARKRVSGEVLRGDIEFKDVWFEFKDKEGRGSCDPVNPKWALKGVSFRIEGGKLNMIVGGNGAGKSTVLKLLQGIIVPDLGHITIGGRDIQTIDSDQLREAFAVVPQFPQILSGTLEEAITFSLTDEERSKLIPADIVRVVRRSRMASFIHRLGENPLRARIGEDGQGFSGGELQMIAVAQAMMRDPKVLLLDEISSAMDNVNSAEVFSVVSEMTKGREGCPEDAKRTGVVIAHSTKTIRLGDKVIMLKEGEVVAVGTHQELIDAKSPRHSNLYAQLFFEASLAEHGAREAV